MKFKKEELKFLEMYFNLLDTRSFLNNKIYIKFNKDNNEVIFAQQSRKFNLITKISKDLGELENSHEMIVDTKKLFQLINLIPQNLDILFIPDKCSIKFGNSVYNLENYQGDYSIIYDLLNLQKEKEIKIVDLKKIFLLKNYCGQDELSTIALLDGHFQASNIYDVAGIIKNENDKSIKYFFPSEFLSIIKLYNLDSIILNIYKNSIMSFEIENTIIIINEFKYSLENHFDEEIKELYEHNTKITVNKDILLEAIQRITVVAKDNLFNRIFMSFDTNNIILESIDTGYSIEKIQYVSLDKEIKDVKIIISAEYFKKIISSLNGEIITIRISNDKDSVAIKFEDEINDRFFIQILCEENEDLE